VEAQEKIGRQKKIPEAEKKVNYIIRKAKKMNMAHFLDPNKPTGRVWRYLHSVSLKETFDRSIIFISDRVKEILFIDVITTSITRDNTTHRDEFFTLKNSMHFTK
jgi:hypothetical protein